MALASRPEHAGDGRALEDDADSGTGSWSLTGTNTVATYVRCVVEVVISLPSARYGSLPVLDDADAGPVHRSSAMAARAQLLAPLGMPAANVWRATPTGGPPRLGGGVKSLDTNRLRQAFAAATNNQPRQDRQHLPVGAGQRAVGGCWWS
jgi:hypothetical protein